MENQPWKCIEFAKLSQIPVRGVRRAEAEIFFSCYKHKKLRGRNIRSFFLLKAFSEYWGCKRFCDALELAQVETYVLYL